MYRPPCPHRSRPFLGLLAAAALALPALAQDEAPEPRSVPADTAAAVEMDAQLLEASVRPLDKAEALAELDGWIGLVRQKAEDISAAEIASMTAEDGSAETESNQRAAELRIERDALIKRAKVVMALAKAKGAEVDDQEVYLRSVVVLPPVRGVNAAVTTFLTWLKNPDGGIALGLNVLKFIGTLIAFKILASILAGLMKRALGRLRKTSDLLRGFLVNFVSKVVLLVGLVMALSMLGLEIGPFLAAIGAAGFVLAFALQGTLSNFAAGVMIMIYRPYDVGDFVKAAGVSGTVDSMNLVSTTVKTPDNQTIIIPNSSLWGDVITNVTANDTRRVDLVFGIAYGDDIDKATKVLREVATAHELVLDDPAPVIEVGELADSSVNLLVRPWSKTSDYWRVYWDLTRQVKQRFDREGISIPFPQRDVYLHQVGEPVGAP